MAIGKRRRAIPWEDIKKAFVEGLIDDAGNRHYPTIVEVSSRFETARGSVSARAFKEQWAEQREIFAAKIDQITANKTIEAISDAGSKFDLLCFNVSADAIKVLEEKVACASRGSDIDDISKLSTALKNFQSVARIALGLPTDISKTSGSLNVTAKDLTRMDEDG